MKKALSLILAGMLVLAAAGCGSSNNSNNNNSNSTDSSATAASDTKEKAAVNKPSELTLSQTDDYGGNKRTITISYPENEVKAEFDESEPHRGTLINASKDFELSLELLIGYGYSSYKDAMREEEGFVEHKVGNYDAFSYNLGSTYETNIVFEDDGNFDSYLTVYTTEAEFDNDKKPVDIFNSKDVIIIRRH